MMDAMEYLKQASRMCKYYNGDLHDSDQPYCYHNGETCPLSGTPCSIMFYDITPKEAEKVPSIVEKWAEKHPMKLMKDHILEFFPNIQCDEDGYPKFLSPCTLDANIKCGMYGGDGCSDCRKDFFGKEYKG